MLFSTQLEGLDPRIDDLCKEGVEEVFSKLDLMDLNAILYRCEGEEKDVTGQYELFDLATYSFKLYRRSNWSVQCSRTRSTSILWSTGMDDTFEARHAVQ